MFPNLVFDIGASAIQHSRRQKIASFVFVTVFLAIALSVLSNYLSNFLLG
jgi:hypothetical protein